jgi:uncharacterized protein (DUF2267 family)
MKEHDLIESAITTSRQWLHELLEKLELPEEEAGRAFHALRAGLHAIRDRLPATEAIHLGAQLPTLVRGIYYDGFRLNNEPSKIRTRAEMIQRVQRELEPDKRLSALAVLHSVIALIEHHVSAGEIDKVVSTLPKAIAELWKPAS